jgi:hypothetical protein
VVLLVLAIIWAVLLISWLRSRTEGSFSDSVGTFRRHLTVLERAAPSTVAPANRLRAGPIGGRGAAAYRSPVRPASSMRTGYRAGPIGGGAVGVARRPASSATLRRRKAQKRRRDVFFALVAGVVGTLAASIIPGLSVMWPVQAAFDVVFVGYVALLIRMRNLAAERELKLTFMPQQGRGPRSAHSARPRPTYDFGSAGYGELALRRAAN